jgi:D-alanine--poly(phosphoribitol) ligase subunit 1
LKAVVNGEAPASPPWSVDPGESGPPPALGDLLAAPARRWPERTAIDDGDTGFTFAQLERGARAVAAWLAGQGVGAGDRVAVLAEKRAVTPLLAVAIWKCGGVYVPLDAAEPAARLQGLLTRLRPAVVITPDERDPGVAAGRLGAARLAEILTGPAADHATVAHHPDQAAYIVFASSPAGEPQGVEISPASLFACFHSHNEVLRVTPDSRVLGLAPFHVDVSFLDTLLPLSLGAFVHQFRGLPAGPVIRAVLGRERVTHLIAVSLLLTMITGDGRQLTRAKLPALQVVLTGAEVCDPGVLAKWKRQLPETRVVHAFGPPEATVFCLTYEVGSADADRTTAYPIGKPLRGMVAKIVRDGVEVHEPGAQGELWVGGDQVMRGYFDHPGETARLVTEVAGTRYFRTGDICSRDPDGDLVFHRHDDPEIVWLMGRRTHLAEIRRVALGCPGVEQAAVAVVPRGGRAVVALVVVARERRAVADVEAHLAELPPYLRPAVIGWSPAAEPGDLAGRLAAAASRSNSARFVLAADGAAEPFEPEPADKGEPCP